MFDIKKSSLWPSFTVFLFKLFFLFLSRCSFQLLFLFFSFWQRADDSPNDALTNLRFYAYKLLLLSLQLYNISQSTLSSVYWQSMALLGIEPCSHFQWVLVGPKDCVQMDHNQTGARWHLFEDQIIMGMTGVKIGWHSELIISFLNTIVEVWHSGKYNKQIALKTLSACAPLGLGLYRGVLQSKYI